MILLFCCSQMLREANSLRRTEWLAECSLLHWRVRGSFLFSQGSWPTFVKTLYTLSVRAQDPTPNSLNLAWKMLKGDAVRSQPWFTVRRVSCLYTVAYASWCPKGYRGDWRHGGLLRSFRLWEIFIWNLVFISPGGLFCCRYVISMATRHIVQSSLKMQGGA